MHGYVQTTYIIGCSFQWCHP